MWSNKQHVMRKPTIVCPDDDHPTELANHKQLPWGEMACIGPGEMKFLFPAQRVASF
jgi:hypothetical protein